MRPAIVKPDYMQGECTPVMSCLDLKTGVTSDSFKYAKCLQRVFIAIPFGVIARKQEQFLWQVGEARLYTTGHGGTATVQNYCQKNIKIQEYANHKLLRWRILHTRYSIRLIVIIYCEIVLKEWSTAWNRSQQLWENCFDAWGRGLRWRICRFFMRLLIWFRTIPVLKSRMKSILCSLRMFCLNKLYIDSYFCLL